MADPLTQQFVNLCQLADTIKQASLDCRDMEPVLITHIQFVKAHPDQWPKFVKLFLAVANNDMAAPDDLLPFCMRELRFPEMYNNIVEEWNVKRDTARWARRMNFMHQLIRAFDDAVWEDAARWPYYTQELKQPSD